MRLTCPCGIHGSIELFSDDEHARKFGKLVAELPAGVGPVAIEYIGLFRPAKQLLRWKRAHALMSELAAMLKAGAVEHYSKRYPAAPSLFAQAMQQMLDRREGLSLPLKSHGYLVSIIVAGSPKEAAKAEAESELQKRTESARRRGPDAPSPEQLEHMRRVREQAQAALRRVEP